MTQCCKLCGQALPEQPRKDPPLPPLDQPTLVTIHDLPPGTPVEIDTSIRGVSLGPLPVISRKFTIPETPK